MRLYMLKYITMKKQKRKLIFNLALAAAAIVLLFVVFTVFVDQAVFVRKKTFYRAHVHEKVVAITFDDGPSEDWTPRILIELEKANAKATFFMIGEHVEKYPDIARKVTDEGHDVGVHTYSHKVVMFSDLERLKSDIFHTADIIKSVTGKNTKLFRPPKAWLSKKEKRFIGDMGFTVVLWSINTKDWVRFDDQFLRKYILKHVRPGDIILFHDSGGVFKPEGGDRKETVRTIFRLVEQLREMGYKPVTVTELLRIQEESLNAR